MRDGVTAITRSMAAAIGLFLSSTGASSAAPARTDARHLRRQ